MIKTVIVEDEKNARIALTQMLKEDCPEVEIIGEAGQVETAISLIEELNPALIFMDIKLGNQNSFEILQAVDLTKLHVIFTTAYENYAVRAFRFSAIDYLLKPISFDRFILAVDRATAVTPSLEQSASTPKDESTFAFEKPSCINPIEKDQSERPCCI